MTGIGKGLRTGIIESVGEVKPHKPSKHFRNSRKGRTINGNREQRRLLNRVKNANRR